MSSTISDGAMPTQDLPDLIKVYFWMHTKKSAFILPSSLSRLAKSKNTPLELFTSGCDEIRLEPNAIYRKTLDTTNLEPYESNWSFLLAPFGSVPSQMLARRHLTYERTNS